MRYLALATDYDGTLASENQVDGSTLSALRRLRDSGRRLILVTGRELPDLIRVFPDIEFFDWVVAENGALLYHPATRKERSLGDPPPSEFIDELKARGVPASCGRVIVGTWEPHEATVLQVIKDLGLELQVIFNKGAVMVLPQGLNKATGLSAALEAMGLSAHNVVGVGDAENDHAFLARCECSVAVANALPMLQQSADLVTEGRKGRGVSELVDRLVQTDLADVELNRPGRKIRLGARQDQSPVLLDPYRTNLLIAGSSGGGKSTVAVGLLENLVAAGYQFCLVDPEGDYLSFPGAVRLGDQGREPSYEEIRQVLSNPEQSVVVNLLGLRLKDRPDFFQGLLPRLMELRASTGRPHWVVVDEAHHLMPKSRDTTPMILPRLFGGLILVTVHPDQVAVDAAALIEAALAVGQSPLATLEAFARAAQIDLPQTDNVELEQGEVLAWFPCEGPPVTVRVDPPRSERKRHHRKYAHGVMEEYKSFYFRGPENRLNLKAANLMRFLELAEGVDDETWMHHLRRLDYSKWFRGSISDQALAAEAEAVEVDMDLDARNSRERIVAVVEGRYTVPESSQSAAGML